MSGTIIGRGRYRWSLVRDEEGHRTYRLTTLVRTTSTEDGPQTVMNTPGLPVVGSLWTFGNDLDPWAFCYPSMRVTVHQEKKGHPNKEWEVEQIFSTRPLNRCQDTTIDDPLLEPDKISGNFVKYTREAKQDNTGELVDSSSNEPFRGPQAEIDANRPTVRIAQNIGSLGLEVFSEMVDTVNDDSLWGLSARKIKLSNVSWERKLYGLCTFYYTRIFEFDVNFKTFDLKVPDEGTKVLAGNWSEADPPVWVPGVGLDKENPTHFIRSVDRFGNIQRTLLDGDGNPVTDIANKVMLTFEVYEESNFLTLGIPSVIG